jgi:hypothetical protein
MRPIETQHSAYQLFIINSPELAWIFLPFIHKPASILFLNFKGKSADNSIGFLLLRIFSERGRDYNESEINGMKKIISLCFFILAVLGAIGIKIPAVYAQDVVGFSLSLGLEGNGYSPTSMGFGAKLVGDYRFGEILSVGTSSLVSNDGVLTTLEFSGNIRYYFLRDEENLIKYYNLVSTFHLFLQAEVGAAVFIDEANRLQPHLMVGLAAGSRIALSRYGSFYVEPYLRIGYPHIFGVGILGVYRFPITGVFW